MEDFSCAEWVLGCYFVLVMLAIGFSVIGLGVLIAYGIKGLVG